MSKKKRMATVHETEFRNTSESNLSFEAVFDRIVSFMRTDPRAAYRLIIGTDAQVHAGYTKFVTGVVIHRPGRGAWGCYRQIVLPREIGFIQEKLSLETSYSQEVAFFFDTERREALEDIVLPHIGQGADLEFMIDIDAGSDPIINRTSAYVNEMVGRVEAMGMIARIKPDSIVASGYANRMTKRPYLNGKLAAVGR